MRFAPETIATARESGLEGMVRAHWREVAVDREEIPLDIDWNGYGAAERAGLFAGMTARTDAGELVGYNAFFLTPHLHYHGTKFAMNDVLYMRPQFRGFDGIRLILHAEKWLKDKGVRKVIYHSKDGVEFGAPGEGDSLEKVQELMELEEEFGREFPDDILDRTAHFTLADLLLVLGYGRIETTLGRLL